MSRLRQLIRNYFGFTKTETNGFLVLVPLMAIMLFAPGIYVALFSESYKGYADDKRLLDSLVTSWNQQVIIKPEIDQKAVPEPVVRSPFNPNKATVMDLQQMGVPDFLARRIENYRNKGGRFRVKNDLARIYDFPDSLYQQLADFILLPDRLEKYGEKSGKLRSAPRDSTLVAAVEKKEVKIRIDLSTCDTTELKQLRGIGSGFSRRIVKYRSLLGGFVSTEQLREVYGLSDSLYQSIADKLYVGSTDSLSRININIANFKTLNGHPYINYKQAGAILNTRSKKGKFRSHLDLLRVEGIDSVMAARLAPYLTY